MTTSTSGMEYAVASSLQSSIKLYYNRVAFDIRDVVYLESNVNYTIFHLTNGKQHISSFTLKHHLNKLSQSNNFFRINRSICINLDFIESKYDDAIVLQNGKFFSISRRRQKFLHQKISNIQTKNSTN